LSQHPDFKAHMVSFPSDELVHLSGMQDTVIVAALKSLFYFMYKAPGFKTIGVDLEGKLLKKAEIDLIQIFDDKQTFVIDYYKIDRIDNDEYMRRLLKVVLTFVFEYEKILKLFHDGRNDCLALHSVFKVCTINYIDMGNLFTFIKQFKLQTNFYASHKETILKDPKAEAEYINMLSFVYNCPNPGLNKVLEEYENNHNVNHLKDKMHTMFHVDSFRMSYFLKRPMEEEWLNYCVMDVKYLINTMNNMMKEIEGLLKKFYGKGVKHDELYLIARLLSNGHCKYSCDIFKQV